jgi:AraC-like DNA-binding protein
MSLVVRSKIPVGGSPIQSVLFAWKIRQMDPNFKFTARSLPGHLLHYVISGRVRQEQSGRWYESGPGTVIWYHEDELVRGGVIQVPWEFYSVNFIAPTIPPPAYDKRVFQGTAEDLAGFEKLFGIMNEASLAAGARTLKVHGAINDLVSGLMDRQGMPFDVDPRASLWWEIESQLRQDLAERVDRDRLVEISGRSMTSIVESCKAAVGVAPMKRIKSIRMSMAWGLLERSGLSVTEISRRVGYARIHEFSRDYRKAYGRAPSEDMGERG